MSFFSREKVSPADLVWDQSVAAPASKGPPPLWSALTHPVLAPPAGAKPFFLSGPQVTGVVPFLNTLATGNELTIAVGDVCVIKNLYVAFDTTLTPDPARFWSLVLDNVPIGNGFGAGYQFATGWSTTNGVVFWPLDVRITTPGLLQLLVTDNGVAGPVRVFTGMVQGWTYSARFDAGLETT